MPEKDGAARISNCARCGKKFTRDIHHKKYCSVECAEASYKEKHDAYMKVYSVENRERLRAKNRMRMEARKERAAIQRMVAKRLKEVGA